MASEPARRWLGAAAKERSTSQSNTTSAATPPQVTRMFGSAEMTFSPQKRLGSNLSRLSQIQDGKWKVVSDYVTP